MTQTSLFAASALEPTLSQRAYPVEMTIVSSGAQILILRAAWWGAVALLVLHFIVWPGMLDHPSTFIGSHGGNSIEPRWIPIALVVWLVVGRGLIAGKRAASEL